VTGTSVIAIDQGTTSTRAIRYGLDGSVQATAVRELTQFHPRPDWVEQDPEEIWTSVLDCARAVLTDRVQAIGIANQRETILLWDRQTGQPLYNAIVWQDRRTAAMCAQYLNDGVEPMIRNKTGLLLDPYFSATKLRWLLDNVGGARQRADSGQLAAGTVDSFLLWRLTNGQVHGTDVTNASRTMLYNISAWRWDEELLALFDIPLYLLPDVHDNDHVFGYTTSSAVGRSIPIAGMVGDQQAALIGQRCFSPGMVKSTYGTGCFLLANIGTKPRFSSHRLLTTAAYRIGNEPAYAMEGSIFVAGATIKWLRDGMGLIASAEETERHAESVAADHGVYLVPAFVGLGAPHWRSDVRAMISGLTLETGPAHIARAALEAAAFQTYDLVDTLARDGIDRPTLLRVDGGMTSNNWFVQFLADVLGVRAERARNNEATSAGAAYLAGLTVGHPLQQAAQDKRGALYNVFEPKCDADRRAQLVRGWHDAVDRVLAPCRLARCS